MGLGARIFTWWRNEPIGTTLFTRVRGRLVGTDGAGNRYFQNNASIRRGRPRRWVLYNGDVEASKVPPEWHLWLHHTAQDSPKDMAKQHNWEAPHQENLTGTSAAYRPPGSVAAGGVRPHATGDYESWKPE